MRIAIAGLGTIGRVLASKLADGVPGLTLACVAARDEEKARGWLDEEGIEVPIVPLEEFPAACRSRGRMRARGGARADLPADAHRRQAGDGALLRRAAAAPGAHRTCEAARRAHHRADRRIARARCGRGGGRGHDSLREDDDAQAAERARGRAASREERNFGRGPERGKARVLRARRAMRPPAFPRT